MKSHRKLSKYCSIHGKNREIFGPYNLNTRKKQYLRCLKPKLLGLVWFRNWSGGMEGMAPLPTHPHPAQCLRPWIVSIVEKNFGGRRSFQSVVPLSILDLAWGGAIYDIALPCKEPCNKNLRYFCLSIYLYISIVIPSLPVHFIKLHKDKCKLKSLFLHFFLVPQRVLWRPLGLYFLSLRTGRVKFR